MQAFYNGMTLVGSLVVMVLVIVLTYYLSRWYAGKMGKAVSGRHIRIVDRVSITPGCALAILQVTDKFYLVGFSDRNVQLICELEDFDPELPGDTAEKTSFSQLFKSLLQKKGDIGGPNGDGGEK